MLAWLIIPSQVGAQDFICGTTLEEEESFQKVVTQPQSVASCSLTTNRGLYLPSTDTLRARVVFAKFQNDVNTVANWPQNGFPSLALSIIDSSASMGSTHRYNLTNYYRTFSRNEFIVIGKVDTITLSQPMSHSSFTSHGYETNTFNGNKAVLQQLKNRPGFELYDDWTKSTHNHGKCADGIADLIIMVWRSNQFNGGPVGGFASLGSGPADTINGIRFFPDLAIRRAQELQ